MNVEELQTALHLRRTTDDSIRTEEENVRLDGLIYGAARLVADPNLTDTFANAVTIDGGHHKQWYLEHIADYFGIDLPDHEPGIAP